MENEFLSNPNSHFIILYLAQLTLAVIFAISFFYFAKIYTQSNYKVLAYSWFGFVLYNIGMSMASFNLLAIEGISFPKLLPTIIYLTGGLIQIIFLLQGTYLLAKNKSATTKRLIALLIMAVFIGVIMTVAYSFDPAKFLERYFIRIGLRALLASMAFIMAGVITFRSINFGTTGFGKKLLGWALTLYGIQLFTYFLVVLNYIISGASSRLLFYFYGVFDMILIFIMGIGMIIWLLEHERELLKKINSQLDSFIYRTSHDLRAPIATVLGLTNLAKIELSDKKSLAYMIQIEDRMNNLDQTIHDILDFSKSTNLKIKPVLIDLQSLIAEIREELPRKENIGLNLVNSETSQIISDVYLLRLILQNLLHNAFEYADIHKKAPMVKILLSENSKGYDLSIIDNGQGIHEQIQPHIFDMFYRGNYNSSGTGLGLYIVKEAVSRLGGQISFHSTSNEGTTFIVSLPKLSIL